MNKQFIQTLVMQAAQRHGLDPTLFLNQAKQESGFNPNAYNASSGATGPLQLMPATWNDPGYGLKFEGDIKDPAANIEAGAQYMRKMLDVHGGDYTKALAAYNAGPGNVQKYGGIPPFKETQNYVSSIMGASGAPFHQGQSRMSLLDEQPPSNSPVTLADEEEEDKGFMTIHPGMGLSALGAALTASARGESASQDIAGIRKQYFDRLDHEAEMAQKERQRKALIGMVGADTSYGQALADGADPAHVLQQYSQDRGFSHAEQMQAQSQLHAMTMQDRGFSQDMFRDQLGYDREVARDERRYEWQTGENEADRDLRLNEQAEDRRQFDTGLSYGIARDNARFEWQSGENEADRALRLNEQAENRRQFESSQTHDIARDQARYEWQTGENEADRGLRLNEQAENRRQFDVGRSHDIARDNARFAWQAGENAADRALRLNEQTETRRQFDTRLEFDTAAAEAEAQTTGDRGRAAKGLIIKQLTDRGLTAEAANLGALPDSAFGDPAMINSISTLLRDSAESTDDLDEALRGAAKIVELRAQGRGEEADMVAQGLGMAKKEPLVAIDQRSNSETEQAKGMGKGYADMAIGFRDRGIAASQDAARIDYMANLMDQGGFRTGPFADAENAAKLAMSQVLGVEPPEGVSAFEAFKAEANKMALAVRNTADGEGMPGSMSDPDRQFLVESIANTNKSPEGVRKILGYMKIMAEREAEMSNLAREYRSQNNDQLDVGFENYLMQYLNDNPLFPQFSHGGSGKGGQRGQAGWKTQEGRPERIRVKPGQ